MEDKITVCNRCISKVYPSMSEGYTYQCFEHEGDLHPIETKKIKKEDYLKLMSERIGCPIERMEEIHDSYDEYIDKYIFQNKGLSLTLKQYYEIMMLLEESSDQVINEQGQKL